MVNNVHYRFHNKRLMTSWWW